MRNPEFFSQIDQKNEIEETPHELIVKNGEEIAKLLETAAIRNLGKIEDLDSSISPHSNEVFLTEIKIDGFDANFENSNCIRFFELHYGINKLVAVFKPKSGENPSRLRTFNIDPETGLFTRERAAYLVDQYGDLGIVSPTVIRNIDDEIGSLQLYIPHTIADGPAKQLDTLDKEKMVNGADWKKMAMLDRLIDNADRNDENFLVVKDDSSKIFAIDHGFSFCLVPDPCKESNRAYQYFAQNKEKAFLDNETKICLEKILSNEQNNNAEIDKTDNHIKDPELIAKGLISTRVFDRARKMLELNSILI